MYCHYGPPERVPVHEFRVGDLLTSGNGGHTNGIVTASYAVGLREWHLAWVSHGDDFLNDGVITTWTGSRNTPDMVMRNLGAYIIEEDPV